MWYVIQTVTGKEQEMADAIRKTISHQLYNRCFILRRECLWRLDGRYIQHIETLFPSYVFIDAGQPEELFYALKSLPGFTKLLRTDDSFWTVSQDEQAFLENLICGDPDQIVRCSQVETDETGRIIRAEGPLGHYINRIERQRLRKRCVRVSAELGGRIHHVLLGIRLKGDEEEMRENDCMGEKNERIREDERVSEV